VQNASLKSLAGATLQIQSSTKSEDSLLLEDSDPVHRSDTDCYLFCICTYYHRLEVTYLSIEMANLEDRTGSVANVLMQEKGNEMKYKCILQCGEPCSRHDSFDNVISDKWDSMQEEAEKWQGLCKFGHVKNASVLGSCQSLVLA